MKHSLRNIVILFFFVLLVVIAGLLIYGQGIKNDSPLVVQDNNELVVSVIVNFGDGKIIVCKNQNMQSGQTVFDALKKCSENQDNTFEIKYKEYQDLGVFIEAIDGIGSGSSKYWQYWVNNKYSQIGASQQKVNSNDVIEWKFIEGQI